MDPDFVENLEGGRLGAKVYTFLEGFENRWLFLHKGFPQTGNP